MKLSKIHDKILLEVLDFNNVSEFEYVKIDDRHYQFNVNDSKELKRVKLKLQ